MCNVTATGCFGFNACAGCGLGICSLKAIVVLLGCFGWLFCVVILCVLVHTCLGVGCDCVFCFFCVLWVY